MKAGVNHAVPLVEKEKKKSLSSSLSAAKGRGLANGEKGTVAAGE